MKKHTLLAACAAALALAACTMPPYNERLSLAQVTKSKLGAPVNAIGPIYANLDPSVQENKFYFLPDRDDPANSGGFLVAEASYGLRVWFLADYSTGLEASWSIDLNNSSQTANNFLLQPVDSGAVDSNYLLLLTRYAQDDLRLVLSTGTALVSQVHDRAASPFHPRRPRTFWAPASFRTAPRAPISSSSWPAREQATTSSTAPRRTRPTGSPSPPAVWPPTWARYPTA